MHLICTLYVALLFIVLTPGVLLRLPPKGPLLTAAIVHGLVFALVYHFTHKMVLRLSMEGFEGDDTLASFAESLPPEATEALKKAIKQNSTM